MKVYPAPSREDLWLSCQKMLFYSVGDEGVDAKTQRVAPDSAKRELSALKENSAFNLCERFFLPVRPADQSERWKTKNPPKFPHRH